MGFAVDLSVDVGVSMCVPLSDCRQIGTQGVLAQVCCVPTLCIGNDFVVAIMCLCMRWCVWLMCVWLCVYVESCACAQAARGSPFSCVRLLV